MAVDVTIMGAGIFGLSCAWYCQKLGANVRVIDPNGTGSGASGGILGALAPHTPDNWNAKKEFQYHSLVATEPFWADVDGISGLSSGYGRVGRVQPAMAERDLKLGYERTDSAKDLWRGKAEWTVSKDSPWEMHSPTGYFIHDTFSARIHPRQAVQSLAKALSLHGCRIEPEATPKGKVIWATGVEGLRGLFPETDDTPSVAHKGQAALLDVSFPLNMPQAFVDGLHIVPHNDGTTAIGSTSERLYTQGFETDHLLENLIERARDHVPALRDAAVIGRWANLRPRAPSRSPVIGPWPDRPGHYIANGGFKIGFGMSCGVGETLAKLVVLGEDTIPKGFRL